MYNRKQNSGRVITWYEDDCGCSLYSTKMSWYIKHTDLKQYLWKDIWKSIFGYNIALTVRFYICRHVKIWHVTVTDVDSFNLISAGVKWNSTAGSLTATLRWINILLLCIDLCFGVTVCHYKLCAVFFFFLLYLRGRIWGNCSQDCALVAVVLWFFKLYSACLAGLHLCGYIM